MNVLELYAGSRSIGDVAEVLDMTVFSVDWKAYRDIDLVMDISKMAPDDVPFIPDVIWASPDCTTYSVAACYKHRDRAMYPKTEYAKQCDATNIHVLKLIDHWLTLNPDLVYFIENPRGMLRKMPWMQPYKRHTVWYCQYGDTRAKPTDIWTNSTAWVPRPECHNGNKNCHHEPAPRGSRTGTQKLKNSYEKSRIPVQLCYEIMRSCLTHKPK